jgi:nicotinamidase-related amidase
MIGDYWKMSQSLVEKSEIFLKTLESWLPALPELNLQDLSSDPEKVAILSMDMINGFCKFGPLASPRVEALIQPIAGLFYAAWDQGVRHILLSQDTHEPEALEFEAYAPHCVRGTPESETVSEFKSLPFYDQMYVMEKNTISAFLNTDLNEWIETHPQVNTFIVVGNCTDICVYQAAMHLRLQANAQQIHRRVIVPANCVDTYDLPVSVAQEMSILPHNAELLHHVFLYHMALNAIEVINRFEY